MDIVFLNSEFGIVVSFNAMNLNKTLNKMELG